MGYVFFIYATLNIVPAPLQFLRNHNLLRLTLRGLYAASLVLLIIAMVRRGVFCWWRFAGLIGLFALYPLIATQTSSYEEQIHFLEYGLVGVFFARAIASHGVRTWKTYAGAFFLGSLAGWIDELLQGRLSNRHYDIRDVWLNIVSVTLGLFLLKLFPSNTDTNTRQ